MEGDNRQVELPGIDQVVTVNEIDGVEFTVREVKGKHIRFFHSTNPARLEQETFEEYKYRRSALKIFDKRRKKGIKFWDSMRDKTITDEKLYKKYQEKDGRA